MSNAIKSNSVIALFALAFFLSRCGNGNADSAKDKANNNSVREVHVQVQELQPRPFIETLQLSGSIKAYDDITLSPEEGGVVKEWKYAKGQFVPKGVAVVVLNDDVIKPSYDAALAQYKSSELTFEKQQKVYSEQAVSEWQLKTTEYNRDAAKAQADLMQARWQRTRITSPVNGILDERYVDKGEMAPPGVPIARVVNIQSVKVSVNVPERYAGSIKLGTPISLTVLAYPGQVFSGKISYIGATINTDNRTFPIESVIPNPGMKLKPEMIAKVKISQSVQKNALLIEEGIVQQLDRNKLVVYVVNEGKAHERVVQLGGRQDNLVEIVSGLNVGEKVITSGYQEVINGQPVAVTTPQQK
ncbi:MAG: efflux RND transporter periplasmic adaptor subunit [Bacteroidota bacterium]